LKRRYCFASREGESRKGNPKRVLRPKTKVQKKRGKEEPYELSLSGGGSEGTGRGGIVRRKEGACHVRKKRN